MTGNSWLGSSGMPSVTKAPERVAARSRTRAKYFYLLRQLRPGYGTQPERNYQRLIMFKFDFDIDDAEEFEIASVKASESVQATSDDEALVLEPFSELPIQQLVRNPSRQQQLQP